MRSDGWSAAMVRYLTIRHYSTAARGNLHVTVVLSLTIAGMVLVTSQSNAAPWGGETAVTGIIDDMWLESDRCIFRISVTWSGSGAFDGDIVDAIAQFLDESTGRYESIASSQGWMVGDELSGTLQFSGDEYGVTYWIELTPKSDENYAEPLSYFERNPLVLYVIAIVAVFAVSQFILVFVFRMKRVRRSGSEEWRIIRFMKRI